MHFEQQLFGQFRLKLLIELAVIVEDREILYFMSKAQFFSWHDSLSCPSRNPESLSRARPVHFTSFTYASDQSRRMRSTSSA